MRFINVLLTYLLTFFHFIVLRAQCDKKYIDWSDVKDACCGCCWIAGNWSLKMPINSIAFSQMPRNMWVSCIISRVIVYVDNVEKLWIHSGSGNCQIEQGLTSHQTHYMSYWGRFLQVIWPNQQCQSTEGNQLVFQIRLESHLDHSTVLQ